MVQKTKTMATNITLTLSARVYLRVVKSNHVTPASDPCIGGGNAGISTASQLLPQKQNLVCSLLNLRKHLYRPARTFGGAPVFSMQNTIYEAEVIPETKLKWIKQKPLLSTGSKYHHPG